MWTSALFCAKNLRIFWNLWWSARTRGGGGWLGWATADKGERSIFREFVRTYFVYGP